MRNKVKRNVYDDYTPYYKLASDILESNIEELKKELKRKFYVKRKRIAEMYFFYTSNLFKTLSLDICSWNEHLERRGITRKEIEYMKECFDDYKVCKKNLHDGWVVRLRPTEDFYIKLGEHLCPIDINSKQRFCHMHDFINKYATAIANKKGDIVWQRKNSDLPNFTTEIRYEMIQNGMYFVIPSSDGTKDLVYTKQGSWVYDVELKNIISWKTILDEDILGIWKCGERWDINGN